MYSASPLRVEAISASVHSQSLMVGVLGQQFFSSFMMPSMSPAP